MKAFALGEVFSGRGRACENTTDEDFLNLVGSHYYCSPLVFDFDVLILSSF